MEESGQLVESFWRYPLFDVGGKRLGVLTRSRALVVIQALSPYPAGSLHLRWRGHLDSNSCRHRGNRSYRSRVAGVDCIAPLISMARYALD